MTARPIFVFVLFAAFLIYCLGTNFAVAASSQKFYCSVQVDMAEAIERDFRATDLKPEHFQNENQNFLARRVARCMEKGEAVRECVLRQCMGKSTAIFSSLLPVGSAGIPARLRACYEKLGDEYVIASSRVNGMPREQMIEHIRTATNVDAARTAQRYKLAAEVWANIDPIEWFGAKLRACMGEKESTSRTESDFVTLSQQAKSLSKPPALSPEQAQVIHVLAYGQCPMIEGMKNGCPREWLDIRPDIYMVNPQYICGYVHMKPNCPANGMHIDGSIYLSEHLDYYQPRGISTLIHESVHYFQWLQRNRAAIQTCEEFLRIEHFAYAIQARYLTAAGDDIGARSVLVAMAQVQCPAESGS